MMIRSLRQMVVYTENLRSSMDEESFRAFESYDFNNDKNFQAGWNSIVKFIDPEKLATEYVRAKAFFFSRNVRAFDYVSYLEWKKDLHQKKEKIGDLLTGGTSGKQSDHEAGQDLQRDEENLNKADALAVIGSRGKSSETASQPLLALKAEDISSVNIPSVLATFQPSVSKGSASFMEIPSQALGTLNPESESDVIAAGLRTLSNMEKIPSSSQKGDCAASANQNLVHEESSLTTVDSAIVSESQNDEEACQLSLAEVAELIQNNKPIPGVITVNVKPTNTDPTPSVISRKSKPWEVATAQDSTSSISSLSSFTFS